MEIKKPEAEFIRRSLHILKVGLETAEIRKYNVTFTMTILQGFLLLARQHYKHLITDDSMQLFSDLVSEESDGNDSLIEILRRMRNAMAHFEYGYSASDGQITEIRFFGSGHPPLKMKTKELVAFTEKFGIYLLGFVESKNKKK